MIYPVVVHKDASSSYGVTIPDMPGVFTAGDTLEEALASVQEAVEAAYDGEEEVPGPSSFELHQGNPDYQDGVLAIVDIDVSRIAGPAVRINITIPRRDLEIIDAAAKRAGSNRSSFLRDSALQAIAATSAKIKKSKSLVESTKGIGSIRSQNDKRRPSKKAERKGSGPVQKTRTATIRKVTARPSRRP